MPSRSVDHPVKVRVQLTVHPELERLAAAGDPLGAKLRAEVTRDLGRLLGRLGIPGKPLVAVQVGDQAGGGWAVVAVNGRRCRLPRGRDQRVRRQVLAQGDGSDQPGIVPWLRGALADPDQAAPVVDFCRTAVLEAVKARPSRLLAPAQAQAYGARLALAREPAWVERVLGGMLDLRRSIADVRRVGEALEAARDLSPDDAVEEVAARLAPAAVEVHLPEPYLRELTCPPWGQLPPAFGELRTALYERLGVPYPRLRAVLDHRLRPRSFAVTVNDLPLLPWQGLGPQQCLVDAPPERVGQAGLEGLGRFDDPLTGNPGTLLPVEQRAAAEALGWTTWGPLQLLARAAAVDLWANAPCFLDQVTVGRQLEELEAVFPHLAGQARAVAPARRLAPVLRALVAEGVGVRNLRLILERLLDAGDAATQPVDKLVAWVRPALTPAVVHQHAGEAGTVAAWTVDPELETLLRRGDGSLADGDRDRILEAIGEGLERHPPGGPMPLVVAAPDVRLALHRVVAEELPQLRLLGYDELPAGVDVKVVSRVGLSPRPP